MTTKFTTLNSTYEVDEEDKLIRRLEGKTDPTPRQGKDGEWQPYHWMSAVDVGEGVLIQYRAADSRSTITSPVKEIL